MLGSMMALGMMIHIANGILVLPLIYALVVSQRLSEPPWFRGVQWGATRWMLAQMVVMPLMGAGPEQEGAADRWRDTGVRT